MNSTIINHDNTIIIFLIYRRSICRKPIVPAVLPPSQKPLRLRLRRRCGELGQARPPLSAWWAHHHPLFRLALKCLGRGRGGRGGGQT